MTDLNYKMEIIDKFVNSQGYLKHWRKKRGIWPQREILSRILFQENSTGILTLEIFVDSSESTGQDSGAFFLHELETSHYLW